MNLLQVCALTDIIVLEMEVMKWMVHHLESAKTAITVQEMKIQLKESAKTAITVLEMKIHLKESAKTATGQLWPSKQTPVGGSSPVQLCPSVHTSVVCNSSSPGQLCPSVQGVCCEDTTCGAVVSVVAAI
jgi:hypothetical protein